MSNIVFVWVLWEKEKEDVQVHDGCIPWVGQEKRGREERVGDMEKGENKVLESSKVRSQWEESGGEASKGWGLGWKQLN